MSFRVGTPNYGLPQTEGTDKRDWSDTNQPFLLIDTAIKNAVDTSATASAAAATAQQTADGASTAAAHAQTDATTAQTLATSASELATTAKNRADAAYTLAQDKAGKQVELGTAIGSSSKTYAQLMEELRTLVWNNREYGLQLIIIDDSESAAVLQKARVVARESSVTFSSTVVSSSVVTITEYVFRASNTVLTASIGNGTVITNHSSETTEGITLILMKLAE